MDIELLKRLCDARGIPGSEGEIRELAAAALEPLVDELRVDPLGNLIGIRRGSGPRVMVAAHMDEIGFRVSHIDDNGFLRLMSVGGNRVDALASQRVVVSDRDAIRGVLFLEASVVRKRNEPGEKQAPRMEDYYVDVGLNREEAMRFVRVGDMVTMDRDMIELGEGFSGKSMDDRVGVFVVIEALRSLASHGAEICVVGTVQEELGCRGAKVAAYGLCPDVAVAVDVCSAEGVPGAKDYKDSCALGKGVALTIVDQGTISDRRLVAFVTQVAEESLIPYQIHMGARGGTDARDIHQALAGVPTMSLSIPTRYVHSCSELVYRADVEATIALLARFLEKAHETTFGFGERLNSGTAASDCQ